MGLAVPAVSVHGQHEALRIGAPEQHQEGPEVAEELSPALGLQVDEAVGQVDVGGRDRGPAVRGAVGCVGGSERREMGLGDGSAHVETREGPGAGVQDGQGDVGVVSEDDPAVRGVDPRRHGAGAQQAGHGVWQRDEQLPEGRGREDQVVCAEAEVRFDVGCGHAVRRADEGVGVVRRVERARRGCAGAG